MVAPARETAGPAHSLGHLVVPNHAGSRVQRRRRIPEHAERREAATEIGDERDDSTAGPRDTAHLCGGSLRVREQVQRQH